MYCNLYLHNPSAPEERISFNYCFFVGVFVCEIEFLLGRWFGFDVMIDRRSCILLYKYTKYIINIPMCKSKYHDLVKAFDRSASCTVVCPIFFFYCWLR